VRTDKMMADFQFLGNRVSKLNLDTRLVEPRGRVDISFDTDYNIKESQEPGVRYLGILELIIKVKATIKKKLLFKIELEMEGAFTGDAEKLTHEKFAEMLEMNGLITLLQISRAYILSVTCQSGINPPVKMPMINVFKLREQKKSQLRPLSKR